MILYGDAAMTHPRTQDSDVHGRPDGPTDEAGQPRTTAELRSWVRRRLGLSGARELELFQAIEQVVANQRQLIEESKHEAIRALSEGFAAKLEKLHHQLTEKDVTVSNIARYFEDVVADLTEKSHRDPKTKLLNFDWFMERVESFLAVEQRVRWCGVGVVDITSFKWYNDTLGHALGDRIIERVARILSDQIRSEDFLAVERSSEARDLHARFGGDEFCFLIPICPGAWKPPSSPAASSKLSRATNGGTRTIALAPSRSASMSASYASASAPSRSDVASLGSWPPS